MLSVVFVLVHPAVGFVDNRIYRYFPTRVVTGGTDGQRQLIVYRLVPQISLQPDLQCSLRPGANKGFPFQLYRLIFVNLSPVFTHQLFRTIVV